MQGESSHKHPPQRLGAIAEVWAIYLVDEVWLEGPRLKGSWSWAGMGFRSLDY